MRAPSRTPRIYKNPKVDELLDKALSLTDQAERAKLYEEATRIVVDDAAGLWIYNTKWYGPYSNKLKGIVFCPIGTAQEMRTAYYEGYESLCRCGSEGAAVSSRRLSPGSTHPRTSEQAEGWIPGTRPGMTAICGSSRSFSSASRGLRPTLAGLVAIVFLISRVIPSDPVALLAGETASRAQIEALAAEARPRPAAARAARSTTTASSCRGDLGTSLFTTRPVIGRPLRAAAGHHRADDRGHDRVAVAVGIPLGVVCRALAQLGRSITCCASSRSQAWRSPASGWR